MAAVLEQAPIADRTQLDAEAGIEQDE